MYPFKKEKEKKYVPFGAKQLEAFGDEALEAGNLDLAIEWYLQLIAAKSNESRLYVKLGNAYSAQHNAILALEAYHNALEINPKDAWAKHYLSQLEYYGC
jgi:tetratricopeptide (TPR) repeat protein